MTEFSTPPEARESEIKGHSDLTKATTMLLSDAPQEPVDAVFFFGRSYFDAGKKDLFAVVADLVGSKKAGEIFILDFEGESEPGGVHRKLGPGKSLWTDRLVKLGVDQSKITYCPHPDPAVPNFNTRTEAQAFVDTSKKKGVKTAVVIAHPHQIVRGFLTSLKVAEQEGATIDFWAQAPQTTDWNKVVKGSQGLELKPRYSHIQDEIKRIFEYQAKGDIATFDELFDYLKRRDNKNKETS